MYTSFSEDDDRPYYQFFNGFAGNVVGKTLFLNYSLLEFLNTVVRNDITSGRKIEVMYVGR
jgi:hypothetical protein